MKIFISLILLVVVYNTNAQTKRALFLGNSYTNVNNLPQLTSNAALSAGDTLIVDKNTPGGYTLEGHSTNTTSLNKIMQGDWDFVVLQEQSQRPSFPISQVQQDVFPYANQLDSIINAYNSCAETVFYMTWGRKNGDANNCQFWPPVCTYEGMDSLLNLRYMMMADMNDAIASPVGAVWNHIRQTSPLIELYAPDESHPSVAGSYAAACSFYTVIFRKDPTFITFNSSLSQPDASVIRTAVKEVVFDSLENWFVGSYDLSASFTYLNTGGGLTYQFTNTSQNSSTQLWDFGFSTDTSSSPLINFPTPGTFNVQLTSFTDCDTVMSSQQIMVTTTGIESPEGSNLLLIYPNPTNGHVNFKSASAQNIVLGIYNYQGKLIKTLELSSRSTISVADLNPGVYIATSLNSYKINKKRFVIYE